MWQRYGADVTCVEFLSNIGGMGIDLDVAKNFQRILQKQGLKFKLDTKVTSATRDGDKIKVAIEGVKNQKQEEVSANHVLEILFAGKFLPLSSLQLIFPLSPQKGTTTVFVEGGCAEIIFLNQDSKRWRLVFCVLALKFLQN